MSPTSYQTAPPRDTGEKRFGGWMAPAAVRGAIIDVAPSCVKVFGNPTPWISIPGKRLARISIVDLSK